MAINIVDSGTRRNFNSGAVRDIQSGKGRCDLLPLDVIAPLMDSSDKAEIISAIGRYMMTGQDCNLYKAIHLFADMVGWSISDCMLEVAIHYEDGATKYGERNWEKGIPLHSFIDSGVRHFLKFIRGDVDERHDRAFVWNMLGAIWTGSHHRDQLDIPFEILGANVLVSRDGTENACDVEVEVNCQVFEPMPLQMSD